MRGIKFAENVTANCSDKYKHVDHQFHYNRYFVERLEMMKRIWEAKSTALWCEMTAFKYRIRMGTKPSNPIEQRVVC